MARSAQVCVAGMLGLTLWGNQALAWPPTESQIQYKFWGIEMKFLNMFTKPDRSFEKGGIIYNGNVEYILRGITVEDMLTQTPVLANNGLTITGQREYTNKDGVRVKDLDYSIEFYAVHQFHLGYVDWKDGRGEVLRVIPGIAPEIVQFPWVVYVPQGTTFVRSGTMKFLDTPEDEARWTPPEPPPEPEPTPPQQSTTPQVTPPQEEVPWWRKQ